MGTDPCLIALTSDIPFESAKLGCLVVEVTGVRVDARRTWKSKRIRRTHR